VNDTFGVNQFTQITIDTVYASTTNNFQIYIHSDSVSTNGYRLKVYYNKIQLYRGDTMLTEATSLTVNIGDSVKLFSYGDTIYGQLNNNTIVKSYDTTIRGKKIGIGIYWADDPAFRGDNFVGGDYEPSDTDTTIVDFCASPVTDSLSSDTGSVGDTITMYGDEYKSTGGSLLLGSDTQTITYHVDDTIKFVVSGSVGTKNLIFTDSCGNSDTSQFTIVTQTVSAPTISGVSPSSGRVTAQFTISGTNFPADSVKLNSVKVTINTNSSTSITCTPPEWTPRGYYTVYVYASGGVATLTHGYRIKIPTIVVGEVQ